MGNVTESRTIKHPIVTVWTALADIKGIHKFHPEVVRSELVKGSANSGVGADRRCDFANKRHVIEHVDAWEAQQRLVISIVGGDMPVKSARATISVRAAGPTATETVFQMVYVPAMGPLGAVMDALVMKRQFGKMIRQLLEGLEIHLTTGDIIGRGLKTTPPATATATATTTATAA